MLKGCGEDHGISSNKSECCGERTSQRQFDPVYTVGLLWGLKTGAKVSYIQVPFAPNLSSPSFYKGDPKMGGT